MGRLECEKISLLGIILTLLLAISETGESLLPDPNLDDHTFSPASLSSSNLDGATAEARGGRCHFPESFRGTWFQSGVHHAITISRNTMSKKGHCIEKEGEKYLVYDERRSCYTCLVFNEKHRNVLQYKETYCTPEKKSLQTICSTITGDAYLFDMFRVDAVPIECPFKGQFTVSYNRGYGTCSDPVSTLDSCTKSSRLVFNYQACPDVPKSESSVEELQCLASWKEGSSRYFLGLIQYTHHASYEDRFRCFVYERTKHPGSFGFGRGDGISSFGHLNPSHNSHGGGKSHGHGGGGPGGDHFRLHNHNASNTEQTYHVAQSGDATCNGLSSMEGSRTMTLRRVPAPKPCQFPSWIQTHSQWHTLDQGSTYTFHSGSLRISNFSELAGTGPNSLAMNAFCYQILDNPKLDKSLVVMHATHECKTGYLCTAFHRRDVNVLEMQFGTMARRAEDACHVSHFDPAVQPYVTLVSSSAPERVACPAVGHFSITEMSWAGRKQVTKSCNEHQEDDGGGSDDGRRSSVSTVSMGCSGSSAVQIRMKSDCDPPSEFFADYNCHGWWSEDGITYLLTTRSSSQQSLRPQRHCFAFRDLRSTGRLLPSERSSSLTGVSSPEDSSGGGGEDRGYNNNNNDGGDEGGLLVFSSFADSCRRNVVLGQEGDFAFNVTKMGQCSAMSFAPGLYHNYTIFTVGMNQLLLFILVRELINFVQS